ncbi:retrovirus-related pol polyprotein from transposon TNT 1-94 [Tanacetum coccineum]
MATKLKVTSASVCLFVDFFSEIELKKVLEALKHQGWVDSMQDQLNQFCRNKVGLLNKERLIAQGYMQEEGIDYDDTFYLDAKMEAIRIFLAYATYMNFKVFQRDVKSLYQKTWSDIPKLSQGVLVYRSGLVDLPKSSNDSTPKPIKDLIIRFTLKNGKTPLFFKYKTFVQTTGLDYNNGNYVALPQSEVIKTEFLRLLMTFVILVLGGYKSSTNQLNSIQQMIVYNLLTRTKIDIEETIFNDLVTKLTDTPRKSYMAYPRFISCVLERLLGTNYAQDDALESTSLV